MPNPEKTRRIPPSMLQRSRDFRHPLTPPEAKVWHAVRNRQLGFKFRRQHPIGRFIADLYCAEARLAIEIDGDTHAAPDQKACDAIERLKEYRTALISAAVTGKIDVREEAVRDA